LTNLSASVDLPARELPLIPITNGLSEDAAIAHISEDAALAQPVPVAQLPRTRGGAGRGIDSSHADGEVRAGCRGGGDCALEAIIAFEGRSRMPEILDGAQEKAPKTRAASDSSNSSVQTFSPQIHPSQSHSIVAPHPIPPSNP